MIAEYKEKLIPQEVLQRSLEEFINAIENWKRRNENGKFQLSFF